MPKDKSWLIRPKKTKGEKSSAKPKAPKKPKVKVRKH